MRTANCLYCGVEYIDKNSKNRKRKYCSRKCYSDSRIGIPLTKKHGVNIGKGITGRIISPETREKIRNSLNGYYKKMGMIRNPKYWGIYSKNREKRDLKYKLSRRMSNFIWHALNCKNPSKNGRRWRDILGYSVEDLIKHLEQLFDPKMNWGNYGSYWCIDHVKPKSLFNYNSDKDKEFKQCWALNNLQPLENSTNAKKSNKYVQA